MLLVVVVNGGMAWLALSTFTGVTTPRAYDRGRTYNDVLAEAARQDAMGWKPEVTLTNGVLRLRVVDAAGAPVAGRVEGILQRPLTREAHALDFRPAGQGRWQADAAPGLPGQWEARLTLFGREGPFDIRARVIVP
jgi:nitrogen fixation protein FixH